MHIIKIQLTAALPNTLAETGVMQKNPYAAVSINYSISIVPGKTQRRRNVFN